MAILERSPVRCPRVQCVREVRVPVPDWRRYELEHFYTQVCGLAAWPVEAQLPGGWGAGDPRRGVYFQFRHDAAVEPVRRRLVMQVQDLEAARAALEQCGWPHLRLRGFVGGDDCIQLADPAGHRVEIRQLRHF
jgi:hypothetical protein